MLDLDGVREVALFRVVVRNEHGVVGRFRVVAIGPTDARGIASRFVLQRLDVFGTGASVSMSDVKHAPHSDLIIAGK